MPNLKLPEKSRYLALNSIETVVNKKGIKYNCSLSLLKIKKSIDENNANISNTNEIESAGIPVFSTLWKEFSVI
ncbi:MAG: hypothetical protein RLZZ28_749 [Bacteroidota bacterium]